jgi:hypothetical protein
MKPRCGYQEFVGLEEGDAVTVAMFHGWAVRLLQRDGIPFVCTRDYRQYRLGFTVRDGIVVAVAVG